jgi:hypothetical protein
MTITNEALKFTDIDETPRPTRSHATGTVAVASVVDAVNAVPNEVARRLIIAALRECAPWGYDGKDRPALRWLMRRGGYLAVSSD